MGEQNPRCPRRGAGYTQEGFHCRYRSHICLDVSAPACIYFLLPALMVAKYQSGISIGGGALSLRDHPWRHITIHSLPGAGHLWRTGVDSFNCTGNGHGCIRCIRQRYEDPKISRLCGEEKERHRLEQDRNGICYFRLVRRYRCGRRGG